MNLREHKRLLNGAMTLPTPRGSMKVPSKSSRRVTTRKSALTFAVCRVHSGLYGAIVV